jgi:CheY-like chemotaxis protein
MTKLLLVEDDDNNFDMLSRRLIRQGFEIVFAVDSPATLTIKSDRARCAAVGGSAYDTRPIDFPRLLGKIQAALAHSREAQS